MIKLQIFCLYIIKNKTIASIFTRNAILVRYYCDISAILLRYYCNEIAKNSRRTAFNVFD